MSSTERKSEILFCFDTEDFTSNHASDAIRGTALLLESEGVKGNYMVVGLLAQQLVQQKRHDVLDALKAHNIGFHTYGHSLHPTLVEYTDIPDYKKAYAELFRQEAEGIGMVKAATGTKNVYAAVPPGNNFSYVAMYAYADMGIPLYCDSPIKNADGTDMYFCNSLQIPYYIAMEWMFFDPNYNVKSILDAFAKRKRTIIYNHPNMILYNEFSDTVNYKKGNINEFGKWKEAKRRPPEQVDLFYSRMRELVRAIKSDERFKLTSMEEIVRNENAKPARVIDRGNIGTLRDSLKADFQSGSFSVSEIFNAVTALLRGEKSYACGKVYGFLSEPQGVTEVCEVTAGGLKKAAAALNTEDFIPASITVDGMEIGPADYLMAGLDVICGGCESAAVSPKKQLNSIDDYPSLRDLKLAGTWLYSDDFKDEYITERLKLQCWTLRRAD